MNAKPTDHDDPRPTRSSGWVVFFLLGALLGVHAIYLMVLPSVEPDHWREFTTDPRCSRTWLMISGQLARCSSVPQ